MHSPPNMVTAAAQTTSADIPAADDQLNQSKEYPAKKHQLHDIRHALTSTPTPNISIALADPPSPEMDDLIFAQAVKPRKVKPPRRATEESPNICCDCKTTDSKLWRRGRNGNLMCNACGLRWRRSLKAKDPNRPSTRRKKAALHDRNMEAQDLPDTSMEAAERSGLSLLESDQSFATQIPIDDAHIDPTLDLEQRRESALDLVEQQLAQSDAQHDEFGGLSFVKAYVDDS